MTRQAEKKEEKSLIVTASIPISVEPLDLLRLASISSPRRAFLVAGHARSKLYVHPGRNRESKRLGHLCEVECVDVKDGA